MNLKEPSLDYLEIKDINRLQYHIMLVIDKWASHHKHPISHKKVLNEMTDQGVKYYTTVNALNSLIRKGYIRRGVVSSNKTYYVQLQRV